jgi:hypothetical protein
MRRKVMGVGHVGPTPHRYRGIGMSDVMGMRTGGYIVCVESGEACHVVLRGDRECRKRVASFVRSHGGEADYSSWSMCEVGSAEMRIYTKR